MMDPVATAVVIAEAASGVILPARPSEHPAAVYLARLAPGSRRTMRGALLTIAALLTDGAADCFALPWSALRYQHTAAVRAVLAERYAPATVNKHLAALRGVLYGGGLRRAEVVSLDMSDFLPETGALTVRHGKGDKARIVYLTGGAQGAMATWLPVRGPDPGALFLPINKGGRLTHRRMTDQAILAMLRRRAIKAGVGHFSPHDLRRTFISDLLDAGADIATVQKLAGHASVATTGRYDRRGEHAKQRAAALLHVPYQG
jgi:integrase